MHIPLRLKIGLTGAPHTSGNPREREEPRAQRGDVRRRWRRRRSALPAVPTFCVLHIAPRLHHPRQAMRRRRALVSGWRFRIAPVRRAHQVFAVMPRPHLTDWIDHPAAVAPPLLHRGRVRWRRRTDAEQAGTDSCAVSSEYSLQAEIIRQQSGEAVVEIHPQHGTGQPRGCKYYLYLSALQLAIMFK
uniref:Uncharacterized protein n=1 Tax=Oryza meridionalis TaxID=40149 RepID=A0A0E0ELF0_9ORYZ